MSVFRFINYSTNLLSGRNLLTSRVVKVCEQQQALFSDKLKDQLEIPQPPKRPSNPYIKFSQGLRLKIKENHPNMSATEVIKLIAQEWKKCDPEVKKELQKEYLSEIEVYLSKMEVYKNSITPEQKNLIKAEKKRKELDKARARLNEKKEHLGKPKRPTSSFIKFMNEKMNEKTDSLKYSEWLKGVVSAWKNLPENDKKVYKELAQFEMNSYKTNLLEWEQNMISQGQIDVVRSKGLLNEESKKRSKKITS